MVFTVIPSLSLKRRSVFSDGLSYPISRLGEMLAIMPPFHIWIQTNHMNSSRFNSTGPKIGLSVRLAETQAEIEAAPYTGQRQEHSGNQAAASVAW